MLLFMLMMQSRETTLGFWKELVGILLCCFNRPSKEYFKDINDLNSSFYHLNSQNIFLKFIDGNLCLKFDRSWYATDPPILDS